MKTRTNVSKKQEFVRYTLIGSLWVTIIHKSLLDP